MNKSDLSNLSNETLIKNEKNLKVVTYMLLSAIIILFVVNIFLALKKGYSALNVIPIALLPIVFINFNSLKEIRKEIKARNL